VHGEAGEAGEHGLRQHMQSKSCLSSCCSALFCIARPQIPDKESSYVAGQSCFAGSFVGWAAHALRFFEPQRKKIKISFSFFFALRRKIIFFFFSLSLSLSFSLPLFFLAPSITMSPYACTIRDVASEDRAHDLRIMRPTRCQLRYCHLISCGS
jgi:hypothetical protein